MTTPSPYLKLDQLFWEGVERELYYFRRRRQGIMDTTVEIELDKPLHYFSVSISGGEPASIRVGGDPLDMVAQLAELQGLRLADREGHGGDE